MHSKTVICRKKEYLIKYKSDQHTTCVILIDFKRILFVNKLICSTKKVVSCMYV